MATSPGAKIGIAVAAALSVIFLFALGLWLWWRRRQKQQLANDMVNFVDGDIVNLVDGGRFEKPFNKPAGAYDPYYRGESSSSITPSPVYHQPPVHYTSPPVEQPVASYNEQPSRNYNDYYPPFPAAAPASTPSLPPSRDMPPPSEPVHVAPVPHVPIAESHAWANSSRHPWSPPDYDAHSSVSESSVQGDNGFHAARPNGDNDNNKDHYPVVALPAILPDPKPEPQAELPARDIHGWGHEQELPAPEQAPLRRQGPPQGNDFEEQKFLLSDVVLLREQRSKSNVQKGPAG
ncbi:hypothetical protein N0V82_006016 [Gnomoniopsis sp. IMI 355080]|nr:hypothetical protein N0V82_006016 [Gnomoniopsis sp. IMI 355080]